MKSDVWSFGVVLYEIITFGKIPYAGKYINLQYILILNGIFLMQLALTFSEITGIPNNMVLLELVKGYRMQCPKDCPQPIYNIMKDCWNETPSQRPLFSTLKLQLEDFIANNYSPLY